jgi:two-component system OmpR family sensor kinase
VNRLARTAERDHELRNGLAGLAGATSLVAGSCSDPERLGTVVASELSRLDVLLQAPVVGAPPATPATAFAVAPVLRGLVTLRASSGMDVRLEVEPDLRALGSSVTLAQVVTNLLANAERHAPGSPVYITAARRGHRVTVRVRDFGPGLPPGVEDAVFGYGVRDQTRGGDGLGLHVCHRLLTTEDGTITAHSPGPGEPGCLVVVELPAASTTGCAPQPLAPSGLQSAP